MPSFRLHVNGETRHVSLPEAMPLLWVLRDHLELRGTKFGCGRGLCGSCTVLVGDEARRSCVLPLSRVGDRPIVTIEGLSAAGDHPVQRAWREERVSQCGYCQPGQILNAVALLRRRPAPDDADIRRAMQPILCRCGTYPRVHRAIRRAAQQEGTP
jgi:isoquinoline 1-oxidoreductase alpha subunit